MLDGVLAKTKEVRARHTVAVLAIANVVRASDDNRPGTGRCACDDGLGQFLARDLELGAVAAVENFTSVDHVGIGVDSRQIAPRIKSVNFVKCTTVEMSSPRNFVSNREDISLRVEVLSHADFTKTDYGHDTDVQRQKGLSLPVPRNHRNAEAHSSVKRHS